jgi:predicted Fe-S protein YdhL (DUF1289 family)
MAFIDTPCVGVCSTVYGDDICRGCKRTSDEVIDWNLLTAQQKSAVYDRLAAHADEIVSQFLTITDPAALAASLDAQSIRYRPDHSPSTWLIQWLRFTREETPWNEIGVTLKSNYSYYSALALFTELDNALYEYANTVRT